MTDTATPSVSVDSPGDDTDHRPGGAGRLHVPGVASLGAGAIHAVAAGVHGDTTQAAVAFTAAAAF